MGHNHQHQNHQQHAKESRIRLAFFLNVVFAILEITGGVFTNSVSIISNAVHDLGDSISLGMAWYFQRLSGRDRDNHFSFGYKRFSVLGAFINSLVLLTGSILVIIIALPRIFHPQHIHAKGMFFLALAGIIVNGIAAIRLKKGNSLNEKVISLHLVEDVLGWTAVLIVGIVMNFYPLPLLDPLLSILITIYILWNVWKNLKSTLRIFLQAIPETKQMADIEKQLLSIQEVTGVHDLHVWSMDGIYHVLTVHVTVAGNLTLEHTKQLKQDIRAKMEGLGIEHTTVEIEHQDEVCGLTDC
ncbi:MAG: cation diffusion facilitator family transporter [Bacteroidales bacterium]